MDRRFAAYFTYPWFPESVLLNDGKKMVCFPVKDGKGDFCVTRSVSGLLPNADGDYEFTYNKTNYKAVKTNVNGYTRYFINANLTGDPTFFDGKTPAYIREDVDEVAGWRNGDYVRYYNTKWSGQDGQVTMTSPVILRWGEVFLNRAEAYARIGGQDSNALEDVNVIRRRAGLPDEAMFTTGNYAERGYKSVLDVVLDERRMELCFEGHRMFDVFRNKKTLDRRYVGYHPFETIDYNDGRIALLIPNDEILASGIPQNDQKKKF